jgi:hypothetical protein
VAHPKRNKLVGEEVERTDRRSPEKDEDETGIHADGDDVRKDGREGRLGG